jgi:outer membrane protein OmpA-like peptidoglycan-associated protein
LFVATVDSAGRFANPQNLGYPINTSQHEGSLFVDANGSDAYYASDRSDSRGGLDLYRFQLPTAMAALPTTYLRGRVVDKPSGKGLPSEVVLTHLGSGRTEARLQTDEQGYYFVTMPAGQPYNFTVNQRGYWFYSDTATLSLGQSSRKNIALTPLEKGSSLALNNILFETNKATLQPVSFIELNNVLAALQQNQQLRLEVQGHTDNTGNAKLNQALSEQRAKAVVAWLVNKGIAPQRLIAKGFGASKPVAPNTTEAGMALNRRTQLVVL